MGETVQTELIRSLPAIIGAITSMVAMIVGLSVSRKADVITGHVNSAAAASSAKIDGLQKEIEMLRSVAADKSQVAAVLAQKRG